MKLTEDNELPLQAGPHELQILLRERRAPPDIRGRLPVDARLDRAIEISNRQARVV
jgi:hypothetical protein